MMQQRGLLERLYDCQLAVETLKSLEPIFEMMLEQFPEDWEEGWIDRLHWLIGMCKAELNCSRDLLEMPINEAVEFMEAIANESASIPSTQE